MQRYPMTSCKSSPDPLKMHRVYIQRIRRQIGALSSHEVPDLAEVRGALASLRAACRVAVRIERGMRCATWLVRPVVARRVEWLNGQRQDGLDGLVVRMELSHLRAILPMLGGE